MIIRWICKNCNKKWIYPVDKCTYCKGSTEKQKGETLRVVGITKVSIPSPLHPIIPYNVALLEDEHGNRIPKKTMKDYRIGDNYVEERAKTSNAVSIVRKKYDVYESVKHSLDLINESDNIKPEKSEKILIKPSICIPAYDYQAATTEPEVINAIIKLLIDSNYKNGDIIVAEQAYLGVDVMDAAAKSGILSVCKKNDVKFFDISKGPYEEIELDNFKFKVYSEALKRKIINVPVMKTNQQLVLSGGMENLIRLADEETQILLFNDNIEIMLPKFVKSLNETHKNIVTIGDATIGMQGQGPTALGEPAFLNLILASRDVVALDSIFCNITMIDLPQYIHESSKIGLGTLSIKEIEVVGNELDALRCQIKKAEKNITAHPDIFLIEGKACSRCFNSAINLTSQLVGLRGEQIKIAIGPITEKNSLVGERIIVYGDCAINKLSKENNLNLDVPMISENVDPTEQILLFKKLLTTKGRPTITPLDKVKTKMMKLASKIIK